MDHDADFQDCVAEGLRLFLKYLELSPPEKALPCYRLPDSGKILVRRSVFDAWISQYSSRGRPGLVEAIRALGLEQKS